MEKREEEGCEGEIRPAGRRKKMNVEAFYAKLLELLSRHSPESLSYSKISRWTGVSRTTIYYYFGSSFEGLLKEAIRSGAQSFLQIGRVSEFGRYRDFHAYQEKIISESHRLVENNPWAPILYMRYRHDPGFMGEVIRSVEEQYFQDLAKAYHHFTRQEADLRSLRLSAYLKLGVLYGLQADSKLWFGDANLKHREALMNAMAGVVVSVVRAK